MKKTCKKFLALFGCIAMLASLIVVPASAESESIVITCKDQLSSQSDTAWTNSYYNWYSNAMGALILKADWNGTPISTSFTANVPESGWYDVEFIIAAWSTIEGVSKHAVTFSKVNYWIDDNEPKLLADSKLNPGGATVETLSTTPLGDDAKHGTDKSEQHTKSKLLQPVYLEKGSHTFNFETVGLNSAGSALKTSYHSITLTPADVSKITLNAGNYSQLETVGADGTIGTMNLPVAQIETNADGKLFIDLAADASNNNADKGFRVVVPFTVYDNGVYNINFDMIAYAQDNFRWRSPVKLKIDDGEYFRVKSSACDDSSAVTALARTSDLSAKYPTADGKTQCTEYSLLEPTILNVGEHTLTFWVYDKPPLQSTDWFVFVLGEINLEKMTDLSAYDSQTLHAGNYSQLVKIAEDGTLGSYTVPTRVNTVNDGKYIHMSVAKDTDNADGYKIDVPVNIYTDGVYRLNLEMATYGRDTDSDKWNSPVKLKVDNGEYFTVKTFATTAEPEVTATVVNTDLTRKYDTGGDTVNKRIADYQLEPMFLDVGKHTLSFWVYAPRITSATQFVFEFGDIGITRMTDFSAYDSQIIHAGNYAKLELSDSGVSTGTYSCPTMVNTENGGKYIHLAQSGAVQGSPDGFKVVVPFKVYTNGTYNINLDMLANCRPIASERWNSPVKIKIDDNDYFRAKTYTTTDDVTVTATVVDTALAEKYSADGGDAKRWAEYALNPVELTAGEHTLTFWVYDKAPNQSNDWHVFGLGEINIDRITDFSALNNITIWGGNYSCYEMTDENRNTSYVAATVYPDIAGNGMMSSFASMPSTTGAVDGYRVNIPFTVYDDGAYDINMDMFAYSIYNAGGVYKWASKPMMKIDDGDYFWLKAFATADDPFVTATVLDFDLTDKYNYDDNTSDEKFWAEYALNTTELTAGNHTLTIWLPEQAPNQSEYDKFVLGLGEINIAPAAENTDVVIQGENLIIEDLSSTVSDSKFDGEKYIDITGAGFVVKEFYVSESGSYTVKTIATDNGNYIIDGKSIVFGNPVDMSGMLAAGWNKYTSEAITLEEGTHTLMFEAADACALDCIRISQPTPVTEINVADINILSIGDAPVLEVTNQDGNEVSIYDVDNICYESSNEDAVEVDAYGKLTAVGMGKATITVGVLAGGKTITASIDVIVVGDSALYVADTSIDGNNVSVTLASAGNAPASTVVVGVYSVEGEVTKLKEAQKLDFASMSADESDTDTVTMSVIGENDKVMVFVFDGLDTFNPLWNKTIAK